MEVFWDLETFQEVVIAAPTATQGLSLQWFAVTWIRCNKLRLVPFMKCELLLLVLLQEFFWRPDDAFLILVYVVEQHEIFIHPV